MILGKLSQESHDEIKRHENYELMNGNKDPLTLWKAIKELHMVSTTSRVESVIKASSRYNYASCKQGAFENIITYKERFDFALQAYKANKNPTMLEKVVAMEFFHGLDDGRYRDFKVECMNDRKIKRK